MAGADSDGGTTFGFYDMFAGIGAFHLAATKHGGRCLGACDTDSYAKKTYKAWFGIEPADDVRAIASLPTGTDFLFAGFPCPTFSLAGKSKLRSLGRKEGLHEWRRGQLIFEVSRIVAASKPRPSVIILENVKHLVNHDGGETFRVIRNEFQDLGYDTGHWKILNARDFGSPQNRQRVFMVFFHGTAPNGFEIPESNGEITPALRGFLESDVPDKYTLGPGTWETLERHRRYHEERGNGFGYRLLDPRVDGVICPTISARYHKDGAEALIHDPARPRPRRLTPREIARIFGFPESLVFPVSDTQAYRQLGNSIVVSVAGAVVESVVHAVRVSNGVNRTNAIGSDEALPDMAVINGKAAVV